jgi:hypothetical protein
MRSVSSPLQLVSNLVANHASFSELRPLVSGEVHRFSNEPALHHGTPELTSNLLLGRNLATLH